MRRMKRPCFLKVWPVSLPPFLLLELSIYFYDKHGFITGLSARKIRSVDRKKFIVYFTELSEILAGDDVCGKLCSFTSLTTSTIKRIVENLDYIFSIDDVLKIISSYRDAYYVLEIIQQEYNDTCFHSAKIPDNPLVG